MKYKIRGAITDDLGQRSLFSLLTPVIELSLYSLFKALKIALPAVSARLRHQKPTATAG